MNYYLAILALLGVAQCSPKNMKQVAKRELFQNPFETAVHQQKTAERTSHPVVGATTFNKMTFGENLNRGCIFQDDDNQWCWDTNNPMLTAGWQWKQESVNGWKIVLEPYFNTAVNLDSKFQLKELITHNMILSIGQFTTNGFLSLLFDRSGQVCGGIGWKSG